MRWVLRRRYRNARHLAIAIALIGVVTPAALLRASANDEAASVHITSPLGRTGLPGKVRIVARVTLPPTTTLPSVRFYVDGTLLATDADGPPYAAEWEDENPFETRKLAVETDAPAGGVLRDEITLQPFEFVEAAQVMSVGVDATVQDHGGRFVAGLTAKDFELREDGKTQPLDSVVSQALPATFALLIDSSQSMTRNIDFVRQAASRLSTYLRDIDTLSVVPFRKNILSVTGPTHDAATIADAVSAIRPQGGTAILDALSQVTDRFGDGLGRRVVVVVTDGYDENSQASADEVLARLKASRVNVYVVAIGGVAGVSLQGERLLRKIASETGGRAFFPWTPKELAQVHLAIADDVQHQYQITYTPSNQEQDGNWRSIVLTTSNPDYLVRARTGYQAPTPPPVRASLEFIVTDEDRKYVELTPDDLEVVEDGVSQRVDAFHEAVAPVSIILALDASGSMKRAAPAVQEAARSFVASLHPADPLGLLVFADRVNAVGELSTRRDAAQGAIQEYKAEGGTALNDALSDALDRLKMVEGRRVVVVMTDGRDENNKGDGPGSTTSWDTVLRQAKEVDATVYAIGLGTNLDRDRLGQIAAVTGGEAYFTEDAAELGRQYRRIVDELHRRYIVAYTSTNLKRDGSWRQVAIQPHQPGLRIRSRGGYFAPAR